MQKKLIALAIAGLSSAAFAQTNVTISGIVDNSLVTQKTSWNGVGSRTQNFMGSGNQGTTNFAFSVTEDLGGGMKGLAKMVYEYDSSVPAHAVTNGESYVGVSGGMGTVLLGVVNTATLLTAMSRQPFTSKIGGGYGTVFGTAATRFADTTAYVSPTWSGVSFSLAHVAGTTTAPASAVVANGNVAAVAASTTAGNGNEIGLAYGNGPLAVRYSKLVIGEAAVELAPSTDQVQLGASYDFGKAKLFGGYGTEKRKLAGADTVDQKNWNIAVDVPFGNFNFMANYAHLDSKLALNNDRTMAAVGVKYSMSKRTSLYGRYVSDTVKNTAAAGYENQKTTMFGISHTY